MKRRGKVRREFITGTLVGVRDGPVIVLEIEGQERKFPLACDLTVNWVYEHLEKQVMCLVEAGKVTQIE